MNFNRSKNKFPKVASNAKDKLNNLSKPIKIGLISAVTVGAIGLGAITIALTKDTEPIESASGFEEPNTDWDSLIDPNEEGVEEALTEENDLQGTDGDYEQPLMSAMWYSLEKNDVAQSAPVKSSASGTATNNYSKLMQKMMNQKLEEQRKEQEHANLVNSSNAQSSGDDSYYPSYSLNTGGDTSVPIDPSNLNSNVGGNNSNQTPSNNIVKPNDGDLPLSAITDKLVAYIEKPSNKTIEDLNINGVTVLEGSSLRTKLFDSMDSLTDKLIIDTNNGTSESKVLEWITKEYPNKLLVSKLDYGFLEESERYLYVELTYTLNKINYKQLKDWANKEAKNIKASTTEDKIKEVATIIASLGEFKSNGSQDVHSPYTLYKRGYGVCQAYTALGKMMLDALGIPNGIATGVMNSEAHTWNVTELNGKTVHIDFTLYDTQNHNPKYLNISDSDIDSDRVVNNIIF